MARVQLTVVGLEFDDGGNTIWIHGHNGTVLRIKCTGQIKVSQCVNPGPHSDVQVQGDINFCIPDSEGFEEEGSYVH